MKLISTEAHREAVLGHERIAYHLCAACGLTLHQREFTGRGKRRSAWCKYCVSRKEQQHGR